MKANTMTAKEFLASKGIYSLDTKKRTEEVIGWLEEYASQFQPSQPKAEDTEDTEICTSCENKFLTETMKQDSGENYFCQPCYSELFPIMKAEYEQSVKQDLKAEQQETYVWVKASEMFPIRKDYEESGNRLFIRNVQTKCGGMVSIDEFYLIKHKHNIEWLSKSPTTVSEGQDVDNSDFADMTKEEIWRKWQSDKKVLCKCLKALSHYGLKKFSDIETVAALVDENNKPIPTPPPGE